MLVPEDIVTVTNSDYYFYVKDVLQTAAPEAVCQYPLRTRGRNTAPAVALAMQYTVERMDAAQDETIFVFPSDHIIAPVDLLVPCLHTADQAARDGYLVTFGVHANAARNRLRLSAGRRTARERTLVCRRFAEKPACYSGRTVRCFRRVLWNSGMFAFTPSAFETALRAIALRMLLQSLLKGTTTLCQHWSDVPRISIDHAVMEKAANVAVVPMEPHLERRRQLGFVL